MIKNISTLKSALGRAGKGKVESVIREAFSFSFAQLSEHRNTSPLGIVYEALPTLAAKPKGLSQKNMRVYLTDTLGLTFDSKKRIFSVPKGLNIEEPNTVFWQGFVSEPVERTPEQIADARVLSAVKAMIDAGYSEEKMIDRLTAALRTVANGE